MIDKPVQGDSSKWKPKWPDGLTDFSIPIGKAKIVHEGNQVTVVSYGRTLPLSKKAAQDLGKEGYSVEVIDLRTLWPYDWETISQSIQKTRRIIFVNEETEVTNFGEHLLRRSVEDFFYELEAKPKLVAGEFVPGVGLADPLEMASVPQYGHIVKAIKEVVAEQP